jgi:hypothetical protein
MSERTVTSIESKPAEFVGQRSQKAPKLAKPRKVERRRRGRKG